MIPVPGLDAVRCSWLEIRAEGFALHGFLLYLASDHFFSDYLDGDGLGDLDVWTGKECAVFVVQSPSAAWIEYARTNKHTWWRLFGERSSSDRALDRVLRRHADSAVIHVDGRQKTIRDVFAPQLNQFQRNAEIAKILHRFNLDRTEHPCLVLFKDLTDRSIWYIDFRPLMDVPETGVRRALQAWFGGPEFQSLLEDAKWA